ncbi:MAG: tRNA (N6-threonylcarbamoyladenosine(37)-N6)-methyltransferase TrmO [Bacteroidales bacterium]|nr:tRNA (N6-threonylcarbamoyladenosine(37)-N6)-methyltransferase TrmO [Bacteroidales bacterium]
MQDLTLKTIAKIESDFPTKFGIPRQSGLVESLTATVRFEADYRNADALRGIEAFSHIWLLWGFSEAQREEWSPTVRPPRLGGNTRMGVFATRSPFRPNALGLSCVRLLSVEHHPTDGPLLRIAGADLMDGTPIYDIKPYLPYADCRPEAVGGFAASAPESGLRVDCPAELLSKVPPEKREALLGVLAQDPRPSYQDDPQRVYGMRFGGLEVRFTVDGALLTVREINQEQD